MYNPSIDLMEKDSMAAVEDFGKHAFNNGITRNASFIDRVKQFSTFKSQIFNLFYQWYQSRKHLAVNG